MGVDDVIIKLTADPVIYAVPAVEAESAIIPIPGVILISAIYASLSVCNG